MVASFAGRLSSFARPDNRGRLSPHVHCLKTVKLPMVEYDPYALSLVWKFAVVAGAEGACEFRSDEVVRVGIARKGL
jgi:hypothetical protein